MKKKSLTALAALASLCAPLAGHAQTKDITIYGTFNLDLENVRGTGSNTIPSRFRLASNTSSLGFRASEDLGGDNKALVQVEMGINPTSDFEPTSISFVSARNTGVGLSGNWGTVMYGIWDTPFKVNDLYIQPMWSTGVSYMGGIMDGNASGTAPTTSGVLGTPSNTTFARRQGNTVQYWSPMYYGLQAKLMYGADAARGTGSPAKGNPDLWSGSVTYHHDDFYAGFAAELHHDLNGTTGLIGTTQSQTDNGYNLAAAYKFHSTSLGASVTWLRYSGTASDGTKNTYKKMAYMFTVLQRLGDYSIQGGVAHAADGSLNGANQAGTNGTQFDLGGTYDLSPTTEVYLAYARIWNGENASYQYGVNGINGLNGFVPGVDPEAFGLGIRHKF